MKLANLHIDRFGARSDLKLDDLSEQLNIVYGPNGSGKTTIISFVRWILYGNEDLRSRGYLNTGAVPGGGRLTIQENGRAHTLQRRNDSASGGRLSEVNGQYYSQPQLSRVSLAEFDAIFSYDYEQPRDLPRLLDVAKSHGFHLEFDERQLQRIQELGQQIVAHRETLQRLPHSSLTAEQIRRQRTDKLAEIEAIRRDIQRRREELDRLYHELSRELSDARQRADALRMVVQNLDAAIQQVRSELTEEASQWQQARDNAAQKNRQHAEELDVQLRRWHEVLAQLRQRLEQIRTKLSHTEKFRAVTPGDVELQTFLQTLGFRIRDIEHDLTGIYAPGSLPEENYRDHQADADYYRGMLGSALTSMRDDVSRLCQTIDRQSHSLEHQQLREELHLLARCEAELVELVERLTERRQGITQAIQDGSLHSLAVANRYPANYGQDLGFPRSHNSTADLWLGSQLGSESPLQTDALYRELPLETPRVVYQHRLNHLQARREAAAARAHEAEVRAVDVERRLREVDDERSRHLDDSRIARIQQEIHQLDQLLLAIEQREHLLHTIAGLEEEVRRLRAQMSQSEVVDTASTYLHRLTEGSYRRIRVHDARRVTVEDHAAQPFDVTQLSRGIGDLTYVSLCLALIEAYRSRGIELPVVVNDSFDNVDTAGTRQLVSLLAEFAQRGFQVLVFTRHEHVLEMFRGMSARMFTLRPRSEGAQRPFVPSTLVPPAERLREPVSYSPPFSPPVSTPISVTPTAETTSVSQPTYRWVAEWHDRYQGDRQGSGPRRDEFIREDLSGQHGHPAFAKPVGTHATVRTEAPLTPPFATPPVAPSRRSETQPIASPPRPVAPRNLMEEEAVVVPRFVATDRQVARPVVVDELVLKFSEATEATQPFAEDTLLGNVATLNADLVALLSHIGLRTVGEFLTVSPEEAASLLAEHGVTQEIIERRQREILLQSYVGVTPDESRLLVACGVPDPERLARADEGVLLRRIETLLERPQTQSRFGTIDQYSLARVRCWIENARRSSYRPRSYRAWTPHDSSQRAPRAERQMSSFAMRSSERAERSSNTDSSRDAKARSEADDTVRFQARSALKFYLELNHAVVDAPSIGPKVAKRLDRIGISTVADLLDASAAELAHNLNDDRLDAEVIRQWQQQTRLVCCVPNLRGHDAQILVACDVLEPTALAEQDPEQLLDHVLKFVETAEGKRVLRNGKHPDLQEVTDWITWAAQARQLRAA